MTFRFQGRERDTPRDKEQTEETIELSSKKKEEEDKMRSLYFIPLTCTLLFHCRLYELAHASSSQSTCSVQNQHACDFSRPRDISVIGNPGTGKSTLLNGLVGQATFESGFSFGGGLTQETKSHTVDHVTLYDTPGLNDVIHREKAAREIQRVMGYDERDISFVFMMTLQSGRIRVEDVTTLHIVLDALDRSMNLVDNYIVILNKLTRTEYDTMYSSNGHDIRLAITGYERRTRHWGYIVSDDGLVDVDNAVMNVPGDIVQLVMNAPVTKPKGLKTGSIDVRAYDERIDEARQRLEEIEQKLQRSIDQQVDEMKRSFESVGLDGTAAVKVMEYVEALAEYSSELDVDSWRVKVLLAFVSMGLMYVSYLCLRFMKAIQTHLLQLIWNVWKRMFGRNKLAIHNDRQAGEGDGENDEQRYVQEGKEGKEMNVGHEVRRNVEENEEREAMDVDNDEQRNVQDGEGGEEMAIDDQVEHSEEREVDEVENVGNRTDEWNGRKSNGTSVVESDSDGNNNSCYSENESESDSEHEDRQALRERTPTTTGPSQQDKNGWRQMEGDSRGAGQGSGSRQLKTSMATDCHSIPSLIEIADLNEELGKAAMRWSVYRFPVKYTPTAAEESLLDDLPRWQQLNTERRQAVRENLLKVYNEEEKEWKRAPLLSSGRPDTRSQANPDDA